MMSQVDWQQQQCFYLTCLIFCLVLILFSSVFFVRCMKYYQYCNHVKNIWYQLYTNLAYVLPTYKIVKDYELS